ncbi:MAG: metal ABC transporter permease [Candidatus Gracilibacteria bacterium]|nr:metal ABC transporter permease [Candidatus Gracilibacteria bacterium]
MLEILKYSFFQNALLGGILISLISSVLGVFIVMRKEANVTHSIANFLFLGVAISLLLNGNYYLFAFIFAIIGSLLIYFIEKTKFITSESTKEIISQAGIAGGIFTIGFLGNLTLDINNFLFGSILFINKTDLIILSILLFLIYIFLYFFSKNFLSIIINEDIAKSRGINVDLYNLGFLIILSIFIALSIKMFGIMLIGAFLIIPANIAKVVSNSLKNVFIYGIIFSILSVIIGLFVSYFLGTSSSATIVLILIIFFIISLITKKLRN